MINIKKGICCVCESEVPITSSSLPRDEVKREQGWDDFDIDHEYGETINFICIDHDFCGQRCEGIGQIPQFILTEK